MSTYIFPVISILVGVVSLAVTLGLAKRCNMLARPVYFASLFFGWLAISCLVWWAQS